MPIFYIPIPEREEAEQNLRNLLANLEANFPDELILKDAIRVTVDHPALNPLIAGLAEEQPEPKKPETKMLTHKKKKSWNWANCPQCGKKAVLTKTGICKPCTMKNARVKKKPQPPEEQPAAPDEPGPGDGEYIIDGGERIHKSYMALMLKNRQLAGGTRVKGPKGESLIVINEPGQPSCLKPVTSAVMQ